LRRLRVTTGLPSSASRSALPSRLNAITVIVIASPGQSSRISLL
jgi:hypothetical protein